MNKISTKLYFILVMACIPHIAIAKDKFPGPSYDCTKASGYVETTICSSKKLSNYDLLLAKTYEVYNEQLKERGITHNVAGTNMQRAWIKNRNNCINVECIKINYLSRIRQILKTIHVDEVRSRKCPPGSICETIERVNLGTYQGADVVLDTIKITDCYRDCMPPYTWFDIYEIKEGNIIIGTDWNGSFSNGRNKLDYQHKNLTSLPKELTKVYFGADKNGCPDCYEINAVLERGESGWRKKSYNK